MRLQEALRDDLLITKRDKPFVVVIDYEKYKLIQEYIGDTSKEGIKKALRENLKEKVLDFSNYEVNSFKSVDGMEYQRSIRDEW